MARSFVLAPDVARAPLAGVGVVADSDLEAEFQESVLKARGLVDAAEEAVRFANAGQWSAGNIRR